tara:strand:- start:17 stop:1225 length:1209 start_codon:yes stop_codon:yes gene_type:complete
MTNKSKSANVGPLNDIRVIELGQLIAGPFCGQLMADMGADVIKVEPPGTGDPMRVWGRGDYPLWWSVCARNKKCITANLRKSEGQELVKKLISQADMVLENFRPGTLEKWGMSYDELSAQNPGLIMIRVSGYGQTGPYSKRAGYASVGEAIGGMRYLCGEPDRKPSRTGLSLGDSLAATYACMGALAALHHREKTGEGQVIDASIYESVLTVMEATIPEYTVSNHIRERSGSKLPNIAPSNIYDCKNGSIVIGANQDTIFRRLCDAMQQPELASDKRFINHVSRGDNQETLDQLINDWCSLRDVDAVEELMELHAVPAGKVYRAPDMLNDPHFIDREAIVNVPSERWTDLKMQNVFPKMSKTQGQIRWSGVEELGAHNDEIYEGMLNLTKDQLIDLKKKSII